MRTRHWRPAAPGVHILTHLFTLDTARPHDAAGPRVPFQATFALLPLFAFGASACGKGKGTRSCLGTATPPCPHWCAPGLASMAGKGKAAGITSRRDPQRLLRSGPLSLLQGSPATPRPTARRHRGRGDGDSIHQPRDTLCQQQGDTAVPFTSQCPPKRDRRRDPIGHPGTSTMEGTQPSSSLKSRGPAAARNTRGHQLTPTFPEGWCPPSAPLPKSPETCVCPGRRGEAGAWGRSPPACPSRAASAHLLSVVLLFLALALSRPRVPLQLQISNHPLEGNHVEGCHGWTGVTDGWVPRTDVCHGRTLAASHPVARCGLPCRSAATSSSTLRTSGSFSWCRERSPPEHPSMTQHRDVSTLQPPVPSTTGTA